MAESAVRVTWDVERPSWPAREITDADLERAAEAALDHGGCAGLRVDVVIVSDASLTELHARFLGDPTPTDVITFDLRDADGDAHEAAAASSEAMSAAGVDAGAESGPIHDPGPDAEVYASVECAFRVALERDLDPARELVLYVVHGALHLCGFDDRTQTDRVAMRAAESSVLRALGYEDEPPLDV